jgi:hypothetical protein
MDEQQLLALKPELDRFLDRFTRYLEAKETKGMHAGSSKDSFIAVNDAMPRISHKP